jgi:hypothetical protein
MLLLPYLDALVTDMKAAFAKQSFASPWRKLAATDYNGDWSDAEFLKFEAVFDRLMLHHVNTFSAAVRFFPIILT